MVIDVMSPQTAGQRNVTSMNSVCSTMHLCISLSPMAVDIKSVKSCPKKVKRRLNLNAIQANAAGRFLVKCEVFSWKIFLKVYQTNFIRTQNLNFHTPSMLSQISEIFTLKIAEVEKYFLEMVGNKNFKIKRIYLLLPLLSLFL